MTKNRSLDLLRRLSEAAGPPGAEDQVRRIVRDTLHGVGTLEHDRLGSIICEKRGSSEDPRVVVDAHLDEVGFMVQSIDADGRLAIVPLGGWWGHVLLGQRVRVLTEGGELPGVIGSTPPHFLAAEARNAVLGVEQMYVDVGAASQAQAESLGIAVGDGIVPRMEFHEMAVRGVVAGKALDDRIGVALMCETLLELRELDHPNTVVGVGAVQEEVGCRGAGTASERTRPDVALVLECTPADDVPGQATRQAALGSGPQIRLYDPTMIPNRRLVRFVQSVAGEIGCELQLAVRRTGGTDGRTIHLNRVGVPCVVIGVPGRYIHSHVSLMQRADYDSALKLVVECVRRLDADRVAALTRFD